MSDMVHPASMTPGMDNALSTDALFAMRSPPCPSSLCNTTPFHVHLRCKVGWQWRISITTAAINFVVGVPPSSPPCQIWTWLEYVRAAESFSTCVNVVLFASIGEIIPCHSLHVVVRPEYYYCAHSTWYK